MAYYIGIDIGTSGTKTLVINARAKVLAAATADYPLYAPKRPPPSAPRSERPRSTENRSPGSGSAGRCTDWSSRTARADRSAAA